MNFEKLLRNARARDRQPSAGLRFSSDRRKRRLMKRLVIVMACSLGLLPLAPAIQPVVAIHDSELTRALETMPASGATPTGTGTTGNQWWPKQWHYFVMPEAAKETLRSDGTAFTVVSDGDIRAGNLLDTNGRPQYPIVVSLAAEAIVDDEIARLTNYVAAGGYLLVGSSAFTRQTNGVTRGDFAFANELGVHMAGTSLQNWTNNFTFAKATNHQIVAHIPGGTLTWQMPSAADEISWPYMGVAAPERIWRVLPGDASMVANGDGTPYLLVKSFGKGCFIYDAAMQPLIGHGGYAPGMYAYGIFRKVIEWSFQSAHLPIPKVSPWPYPYDAAFMVRHDLEDFQDEITNIPASAQFENAHGAKGDYYFCTGTLRQELSNSPAVIANLRWAVTNFNATIGPHNGGLPNPQNTNLLVGTYDYWHWGPDQAYDVAATNLPLPGYPDGQTYAFVSVSNSFSDMEGWLTGLTNGVRAYVAPYFNATREASYQIAEQLNVKIAGETKLGPFPHWTLSTQTTGKRYGLLQEPVSDWYVQSQVAQGMESGHSPGTVHEMVDYYYGLGGLINLYSHTLSNGQGTAGDTAPDYITYSLNASLHPRLWSASGLDIYAWWLQRSNAQVTASFATNGPTSVMTLVVAGASDPQTAVEILLPRPTVSNLQVLTNGVAADTNSYRLNGSTLKLLVGTAVTNVQISYLLNPTAQNDAYTVAAGQTLTVAAGGILSNDSLGAGSNLTAVLLSGPAHGILTLTNSGGFSYTPTNGFTGVDSFTYLANDGVTNSSVAVVTIDVPPAGSFFFDDFARATNADALAPWAVGVGRWNITNGTMQGTASGNSDYSDLYAGSNWGDYSLEAQVQIPANVGAWDAGVCGRLNPLTGERYMVNIYPEDSQQGPTKLRLLKFHGWRIWSYTPMAVTNLPGVGASVHTLKLTFRGNRIQVSYDGNPILDVPDNGFDGVPAYTNGAVGLHLFMAGPFIATFDNVLVNPLPVTPTAANDSYTVIENHLLTVPSPGVLANDTPGLGLSLTATLVNGPTNGTLNFSTNGSFTYTPATNFFGSDAFTYLANDGVTNSDPATVTITVLSNRPPVAVADSYSVVSGRTLTVVAAGVLSNDQAGWGTNLTAGLLSGPTNGLLNLSSNGGFTYLATNHFVGPDGFTYAANDGITSSAPATVTISVTTNFPPVANNDSYNTVTNTPLVVLAPGVLANDTDANGDSLTAVLVSGPTQGTLSLTNNGGFIYTPSNNYAGPDSFTYQASDGLTNSGIAVVSITISTLVVSHPPVANNDSYSTVMNTTLTVGQPGVLANDAIGNGNSLTAILVSGPAQGALILNTNGGFSYTPTNNFVGSDSFIYHAFDGVTNSNPATVTITVTTNAPAGVWFFDDFTRSTNAGSLAPWTVAFGKWSVTNGTMQATASNQSDYADAYVGTNWGDYSVETLIQIPAGAWGAGLSGRLNVSNGAAYTAVVYPQGGSPLASASAMLELIKFSGWKSWSFNPMAQVNLSGLDTNWHNLKLAFRANRIAVYLDNSQIAAVTDNNFDGGPAFTNGGIGLHMFMSADFVTTYDNVQVRPLVTDDSYSVDENTNLTIAAPGVLANDTAVFGSNLVAVLVSGPTNGTLSLNTNGGFIYTPATNYFGPDHFSYQANDGLTNLGIATVNLTVAQLIPVLTVTADSQSRIYGQTNPPLTGSLAGVLGGDNITATFATAANTNSPVAAYAIKPAFNDPSNRLGNYQIITNGGTLTVNPAILAITADATNRVYGAGNPAFTYTASGFVNNETVGVLSGSPALTTLATTNSPAGIYPITGTNGTLSATNYTFTFTNGTLTVNPAPLTVSANSTNKAYGQVLVFAGNEFTTAGLVNTDTVIGATLSSAGAAGGAGVGSYAVGVTNAVGPGLTNYVISYTDGTLIVTLGTPVVTWASPTNIVYGIPLGANQNAAQAAVPGSYAYAPTNAAVLAAGTNLLTVAFSPTDTNYASTNLGVQLVVEPAPLLISANATNRVYGAANPAFTYTASGFVNGETNSVLSGSPSITTAATSASPAGDYPIQVAQGTLSATNYAFSFTNGLLTVILVPPTILDLAGAKTTNVVIYWSAVSNVTYRVQHQANLTGTNWLDLTPDVLATNSSASAIDHPNGAPVQFYRIMIVP